MKTPSQEDLLGYVLGALDAQEQRNVQQLIDENPEIEEQLLQIKNSMLPLDCLETSGPRPGLARRTCETVANHQNGFGNLDPAFVPSINHLASLDAGIQSALESQPEVNPTVKLRSAVSDRILHPTTWSIPDVLVGMALVAIMAGILFPTISYTRNNSRIVACQHNLSQVGVSLMKFSSANEGQFVAIPRNGRLTNIGSFGPILKDSGFCDDDSIFSCAGVAANLPPVHIPSCDQIQNANCPVEIDHYRRTSCGHFGYTMGYRVDDQYFPPRNTGRSNVVLVADQPSGLPGHMSKNHGGSGQNCLFGDGRVAFVKGPAFGEDAIYENDYGVVGPGSSPYDNVIAPSHLSLAQSEQIIELIRADSD